MDRNRHRTLIVFTRYPEAGQSKTRLIPALGAQGAADLQRQMTTSVTRSARQAAVRGSLALRICYAGGDPAAFQAWLGPDLDYEPQAAGDLGDRMAAAFRNVFRNGGESTVIIGSDVPGLSEVHMRQAFEALRTNDLVLGPTPDGGYYLIGLNRDIPDLFRNISWGSSEVFEATMTQAKALNLKTVLLETLEDVDRPEDIDTWEGLMKRESASTDAPGISVIIPTLNEAMRIGDSLALVLSEPGIEVVVADGGGTDATCSIARAYGARVVTSPPGRARQMNAGASVATGEILLFLHADTIPPAGFANSIRQALDRPKTIGGAFRIRLDDRTPSLTLVEKLINLRSILISAPYGDQGLFMRASTFRDLGGYRETPILEDVIMIRRLKRKGRIAMLSDPVVTSARRWQRLGILKTFLLHRGVMLAYALGATPETIYAWLRRFGYYPAPRVTEPPDTVDRRHDEAV